MSKRLFLLYARYFSYYLKIDVMCEVDSCDKPTTHEMNP